MKRTSRWILVTESLPRQSGKSWAPKVLPNITSELVAETLDGRLIRLAHVTTWRSSGSYELYDQGGWYHDSSRPNWDVFHLLDDYRKVEPEEKVMAYFKEINL